MIRLDINSKDYPVLLKELKNPPKELFIKGDFDPAIFNNCVSVVGSRKMSPYGRRAAEKYVTDLACGGLTVVSGFMYGIDAEAHRATLSVGGKTVAVMPCGIDLICPDFQTDLYEEILLSGGLVISEYPGDLPPKSWSFVQRNRIVAGLSRCLLVVEAGEKSGSLITAKITGDLGRDVFVVPGSVFSSSYKGIYQLIEKGAKVAVSSSCISQKYDLGVFVSRAFGLSESNGVDLELQHTLLGNPDISSVLLKALKDEPMNTDQLIRETGLGLSEAISCLTSLTLQGIITEEGDKYYAN